MNLGSSLFLVASLDGDNLISQTDFHSENRDADTLKTLGLLNLSDFET